MSYNDETWHSHTLPREDPKNIESSDTPLEFCWHQDFFTRSQQILLYQEILIQNALFLLFLILLTFFESLKIVLINMVTVLMISAKMATLGLLKIKVF